MASDTRVDKFLVGELEEKVFIKFIGNATMKNSKTLEDFFNELLKKDSKEIVFDFEKCNYMDSTMLGFIAKTAIRIKKEWNTFIYEMNSSNMVKTSLKSTGVYNLMKHLESSAEIELSELEIKDFDSKDDKAKHIYEAHKTLMGLSEENEKVFKNVVDLLEKDLNK